VRWGNAIYPKAPYGIVVNSTTIRPRETPLRCDQVKPFPIGVLSGMDQRKVIRQTCKRCAQLADVPNVGAAPKPFPLKLLRRFRGTEVLLDLSSTGEAQELKLAIMPRLGAGLDVESPKVVELPIVYGHARSDGLFHSGPLYFHSNTIWQILPAKLVIVIEIVNVYQDELHVWWFL
jgi:hypothetical protein